MGLGIKRGSWVTQKKFQAIGQSEDSQVTGEKRLMGGRPKELWGIKDEKQ